MEEFLNVAETLGTITVLAGTTFAFFKGWIISRETHDTIIAGKDAVIELLEEEIKEYKK